MEFSVKPNVLRNNGTQIAGVARGISQASWAVKSAAAGLDTSTSAYATIARKLEGYVQELDKMSQKAKRMKSCAVKVSFLYEKADGATIKSDKVDKDHVKKFIKDAVFAGLGKVCGPVGSLIGIGTAIADGKFEKIPGKIYDVYDKVHENIDGSSIKWKDMFGLNRVDDPLEYSLEKAGKKVSSKATWVFALLESGVDNYKEHGGITGRWVEETGVEAAIDVGEGVLVGVGVGAVAAAAGVTAPAWALAAVGAVGVVAVDAGINAVVRHVTGNPDADWKESVSDFICDTGEAIAKGVSDTMNSIGETVSNGWNSLVNAFTGHGSSCGWGIFNW